METASRFIFKKITPNTQEAAVKPIKDYLMMQDKVLSCLEQVISREYQALKERHFELLQGLSTEKSDLMLKLQSNDQKLKLHPDVGTLKTKYSAEVLIIKNKMKKCHFRNEVNGKLITMCMQSSNRLQALLVEARDLVTRNMTYNNKGSASARAPLRVSVSA
ncbi:flagellar export chaperone FlgN [Succinivibrio dextrinosolvens]|uniref:flagellar export chaperone FlgN n=1 Tax=Succinivibrio dextrinosolvens TaxID=83771 RepID=UPI0004E0E08F|nr:flagellar export chaperone FlgN [Succinivibrio dextrinosolvens]